MNTFFIASEQIKEGTILLEGALCHHLSDVLRIKKGEQLRCSDNDTRVYLATVTEITKKTMTLHIDEVMPINNEPPIAVTLLQCLPKGDKMEQIIQKTVELGVSQILPVESAHSQVRLKGKAEEKRKRWQKIAAAAAEQSGREKIPRVLLPVSMAEALKHLPHETPLLFCYEKEDTVGIKSVLRKINCREIAVVIGPEGGFSQEEAAAIIEKGGVSVTMGPRILRVETAAPVGVALIMYELGDWGYSVEN